MKIASFFSGAGGLDLGFTNAGFKTVFANDIWKGCWKTYEENHGITVTKKSIAKIEPHEIPDDVIGFIGGPPCQSWSLAGAMRGIKDPRGKLFYNYVNLINEKKPLFFLAENVPGILSPKHRPEFMKIVKAFWNIGYIVSFKQLNALDYGVPQDRKRVFIIGYEKSQMRKKFIFPKPIDTKVTLKDALSNLPEAHPAREKNYTNGQTLEITNHEYMNGGFSTIYMSRNRVRSWDEQSFTIQAGGRHAPIHPQANKMIKVEKDKMKFDPKSKPYRRLSVRECARIQTFPDDFVFRYNQIADGYKMIGNAVPVKLAEALATQIMNDIKTKSKRKDNVNSIQKQEMLLVH
ncbi:DNA cytosine methyltransferase [Candidatus Woesearchaeota archaeon]|nr:DNA cytosine methyltransferase [Candidatus Woesearchaeota archaeon]